MQNRPSYRFLSRENIFPNRFSGLPFLDIFRFYDNKLSDKEIVMRPKL